MEKNNKNFDWRKEALFLFYDIGCTVTKIGTACGISKQAVSKFLRNDDLLKYEKEKERRKQANIIKERERKRIWKRNRDRELKKQKIRKGIENDKQKTN